MNTDRAQIAALSATMKSLKDDTLRKEVETLVSAIYGGVQVMPSPHVQQTTILVRPAVYEALKERIERDTEAERKAGD